MHCWRVAAFAAALAGCGAHDVSARLPSPPGEATGSITVVLTQPARDLTVAVNGVLVAERAHSKKVRVTGVPVGMADVVIAAGGGETRVEKHIRVAVEERQDTAIPLAGPDRSMGETVKMGFLTMAAWVLSRALYLAIF